MVRHAHHDNEAHPSTPFDTLRQAQGDKGTQGDKETQDNKGAQGEDAVRS